MKLLFLDSGIEYYEVPTHSGYAISKCGKVLSLKPGPKRFLQQKTLRSNADGYLQFKANGRWVSLHRVLLETFKSTDSTNLQVNHIDGNKQNNNLENLEWCTQHENLLHCMRAGRHNMPEKPVFSIDSFNIVKWYCSMSEAERQTGAKQGNITKVCKHLRPKAGGYIWRYA